MMAVSVRAPAPAQAAGEAGFSRVTLYRARKFLAGLVVELRAGPYDPHKRWAIAAAPSPPTGDSPTA